MTAMPRYDRWMMRVIERQLGTWGEHWADLSTTKQYADWRPLAEDRLGPGYLWFFMTRRLLHEVIYAAGSAEREYGLLQAAMADVQRYGEQAATRHPYTDPAAKWPPGKNVSPKSMRDVSYSFANMITWARATKDRTERRYINDRGHRTDEKAGLLPALAPGPLHDAVKAALADLRADLCDTWFFANYVLHSGAVPGGGTPTAEILPDGRVIARLPDPVPGPVLTWEQFTFTENRDMLTYATRLMASIEAFAEKVLEAFETNRPARVGPLPPLLVDVVAAEFRGEAVPPPRVLHASLMPPPAGPLPEE